jgi:hypothetical protein
MPGLTESDRALVARAFNLPGVDDVCEHTGEADFTLACVRALGEARDLAGELAKRVVELGS